MRHPMLLSILLCIVIAAPAARADAAPGERSERVTQASRLDAKRARVRERIRAMRAWKLTEVLELDEKAAGRLFPILNQYDEQFEALLTEERAVRDELLAAEARGDAAAMNQLIDRALVLQRKSWKLQEQRFRAVRKVLTPSQAARMMIALPEIDRAIHRKIRDAMRGKRGKQRRPRR